MESSVLKSEYKGDISQRIPEEPQGAAEARKRLNREAIAAYLDGKQLTSDQNDVIQSLNEDELRLIREQSRRPRVDVSDVRAVLDEGPTRARRNTSAIRNQR